MENDESIPLNNPTKKDYEQIYKEFIEIFEIETVDELIQYLKDIEVPSKRVCAKQLKKGKFDKFLIIRYR